MPIFYVLLDHDVTSLATVANRCGREKTTTPSKRGAIVEREYLTVGQLARKVGTTVRTLQYYDQQGLLSPSGKGPGNQRLYSSEDENDLYRILTLKYLGLSLSEIKSQKDLVNDPESLTEVLSQTMASLEEDFQQLITRLSVLRTLLNLASANDDIDWSKFAQTIYSGGSEEGFLWHQVGHLESTDLEEQASVAVSETRSIAVAKWHELIADTISLISGHVAPEDSEAAEIAHRYAQLEQEQAGSLDQVFILVENIAPHHGSSGSFDVLRDSVVSFLETAKKVHCGKER